MMTAFPGPNICTFSMVWKPPKVITTPSFGSVQLPRMAVWPEDCLAVPYCELPLMCAYRGTISGVVNVNTEMAVPENAVGIISLPCTAAKSDWRYVAFKATCRGSIVAVFVVGG